MEIQIFDVIDLDQLNVAGKFIDKMSYVRCWTFVLPLLFAIAVLEFRFEYFNRKICRFERLKSDMICNLYGYI